MHKISDFPIYVDFKKQKAKFPCWYVECEDIDHEPKLNTRYFREGKYTVSLFMSENGEIDNNREVHDWAEKLFLALEYITVDGSKVRGTDMSYEFVDDVLIFKVHYNHFIERVTLRDPMQSLDLNEGVKNDGD